MVLVTVLIGCSDEGSLAPGISRVPSKPAFARVERTDTVTGSRYIVRLKDGTQNRTAIAQQIAHGNRGRILRVYNKVLNGFNLVIPNDAAEATVVEAIKRNPVVDYIVRDEKVFYPTDTQTPYSWALDRIDQNIFLEPLDNTFHYFQTGAGVNIYIIDTGVQADHPEFAGRIGSLTFTSVYPNNAHVDCDGHGTRSASVAAGTRAGVAKGATVHALQVMPCGGGGAWTGDIAAAIDWVVDVGPRPAVINLSLGGQRRWYDVLYGPSEEAVRNAVAGGVHVVMAAGNDGQNACDYSPARVSQGITVGAIDVNNRRSIWTGGQSSNWGSCVDIWAPGSAVDVAVNTGGYNSSGGNGTSVAAPYVAGTVALILQEGSATPDGAWSILRESATMNHLTDLGTGSPNRLLYSPHTWMTMSGPTGICSYQSGTYMWSMSTRGGGGPSEYQWYISYNDGNEEILGPNSLSWFQYIDTAIGNFEVHATFVPGYGQAISKKLSVPILAC